MATKSNVYLVVRCDDVDDGPPVLAVYSTKEKATAYVNLIRKESRDFNRAYRKWDEAYTEYQRTKGWSANGYKMFCKTYTEPIPGKLVCFSKLAIREYKVQD